jgi:hypothetical protein
MAPGHVDLSVLWVPIMPETSKLGPAMEDAGKSATESFDKGTSGLGDKMHESFTKATGKVKDVFTKAGNDATESMADSVKQSSSKIEDALQETGKKAHSKFKDAVGDIGKEMVGAISPDVKQQLSARVEDVVGGAFKSAFGDEGVAGMVGGAVSKAAGQGFESWIDGVKDKVTGVKDAADNTRKAFADLTGGKTTEGIQGLTNSFGKLGTLAQQFGVDVGDLPKPIQDVVGETAEWKTTTEGVADIFKGLPGVVGRIGTALEGLAGPLAIVAAGAETIWNGLPGVGGGLKQILEAPDPTKGFNSPIQGPAGIPTTGPVTLPPSLGGNTASIAPPGYTATQGSLDPFAGLLPPGMAPPDLSKPPAIAPPDMPDGAIPHPFITPPAPAAAPSSFVGSMPSTFSSTADLHAGGSRVANLYAVAQSLAGTPYSQGLRNDCSGMVSKLATAALGMSPTAAFSTQNEGQWLMSHGFQPGLGGPGDLNIGWYNSGPNPDDGHTAATLPGGVNAESGGGHGFQLGGGVVASSSQFSQHAHLAMDGSGGSLGIPTGAQHDPLYVMAADSGPGGSGGSSTQSQGQQLGSGLVNGALQEFGLDGSVFKSFGGSSNPAQFGITKLGTGLLNVFGGMLGGGRAGTAGTHGLDHAAAGLPLAGLDARHVALPGISPTSPGTRNQPSGQLMGGSGGGGGGMGGGMGSAISGAVGLAGALMSDLNPGPGAPDSANGQYHLLPNPTTSHPSPGGGAAGHGETVSHNYYGDVNHNPMTLNQHGVQGESVLDMQHANNGRASGMATYGAGSLPS